MSRVIGQDVVQKELSKILDVFIASDGNKCSQVKEVYGYERI